MLVVMNIWLLQICPNFKDLDGYWEAYAQIGFEQRLRFQLAVEHTLNNCLETVYASVWQPENKSVLETTMCSLSIITWEGPVATLLI